MKNSIIKVAYNAWPLLSPHTGIASYIKNLALAMQKNSSVKFQYFYGKSWSDRLETTPSAYVSTTKSWVQKFVPKPYALRRFLFQKTFNHGIKKNRCDIYHEPCFFPYAFNGPTVITIHDLSPVHYPHTHTRERIEEFEKQMPKALKQAAAIITDAESVRQEIISYYGVSPSRITSIHLGVSEDFHPRSEKQLSPIMRHYDLKAGQYFLAVGTLEPRKNLIQVINAFISLPDNIRANTPLVIAGMKGWLTKELETKISQYESNGEIRWLGYVSHAELPLLYSGASMLLFPSLYEGFGLPAIEAMASGIPVITSNHSSLPEVAGDVGILVNPEDSDQLRSNMLRLLEDTDEAKRLGKLGIERAQLFTWDNCAGKTLDVYKSVIRNKFSSSKVN